jgi:replicative DNA helicase
MAFRAASQRRRTVLFEAGDNTQTQVVRRFCSRISRHPYYPKKIQIPKAIHVPPKQRRAVDGKSEQTARVEFKTKIFQQGLEIDKVFESREQFILRKLRSRNSYLRLSCHPNSSLSVESIVSTLHSWQTDGWVPDVIVIDYADILDMSQSRLDRRDQIDRTWRHLRRLSQTFHCLVVTATQTDARSYDAKIIRTKHFSEDKRKLAHVTASIGLNANPREEIIGVMRLNWVVRREGASKSLQCIHVAGCRDIANPAMVSSY